MSERADSDFLSDIQEAIRRIIEYTAGMTYQAFVEDTKTQDAVIRNLEIIGEATNLEQCGFKNDVELEVVDGVLVIKPCKIRNRWDSAFKKMAEYGDDTLIEMPNSEWDCKEWEW